MDSLDKEQKRWLLQACDVSSEETDESMIMTQGK